MSPKIINASVFLILVVLAFAIFANSMTKLPGRDEQMYCTAGALLAQGKMIYKDFSYPSQMPYHPLLYAAAFKILNTTHFLLVGRILSAICDMLVVVCIVGMYRRIFDSFPTSAMLFGLAAAILYVFNPSVDYASGFAWNHDFVILCVVVSFWLFVSADFERKSRYWRIAAIAALLTLAACMRITTALVQLLFFVILLSHPAESIKQRFKTILPFLAASAILLIWPIWTIIQAPRAFFLNLFWIPVLYGEWLHKIGMVHDKFDLMLKSITKPGYFVLIVLTIYLWLTVARQYRKLAVLTKRKTLLAALLPLTFFIIAFIPPTMWRQYLAMPVPFLIVSIALPLLYLRKLSAKTGLNKHFKIAGTVMTISVVVAVVSYLVVLHRIPKLFNTQNWTPLSLHRISEDIAEKTKEPKRILTLAPLYAIEGGCDVYPQLSAGSVVYRIADYMRPSDIETTNTVGPKTLKALLEKSPPSAVILGAEPIKFLEETLFESAVQPDQEKWERKIYDNGLTAYFRR